MDAISCLTWVKKGLACSNPQKAALDEDKLKQFVSQHGRNSDDEADESRTNAKRKRPKKATGNSEDKRIIDNYDLDNYSDDDFKGDESDTSFGMSDLTFFTKNEQDPYITKEENDSDEEDDRISYDDNLILVGKSDRDWSSLEVWVYNEVTGNGGLFCHHDYILPSLPLCVEYVGGIQGKNLAALGNYDASLSLWDFDIMHSLDPLYQIGGSKSKKSLKSKIKKSKLSNSEVQKQHSDAILSLSWNELQVNILASASVDKTVGLWDLNSLPHCCFLSGFHSEKVQTLQWHPCESQLILTGSSDKTAKVFDCRASQSTAKSWTFSGEVEKVLWHNSSPFYFYSGTSMGSIHYVDIRMEDPVYQIDAHSPGSVTDLTICNASSGSCLLSSSEKGVVKVWDTSKENKFVTSKNYKIGPVFCLSACPDSQKPIFAMGGEYEMKVSNLARDEPSSLSFGWTYEGRVKVADTLDKKPKKKKEGRARKNASNDANVERQRKDDKKKAKARITGKKKAVKSKA